MYHFSEPELEKLDELARKIFGENIVGGFHLGPYFAVTSEGRMFVYDQTVREDAFFLAVPGPMVPVLTHSYMLGIIYDVPITIRAHIQTAALALDVLAARWRAESLDVPSTRPAERRSSWAHRVSTHFA